MGTQSKHSSNDSDRRDSNEIADESNFIKKCILQNFDGESFTRLQQVLEFIGEQSSNKIYTKYNTKLSQAIASSEKHLPPDFTIMNYINLKARCYSFHFIRDVGNIVIDEINSGDLRAETYFVTLIKVLLHHVLTARGDTSNLALVELELLCKNRDITLRSLYVNHRAKFLRVIIKAVLQKLKTNTKNRRSSASIPSNEWAPRSNLVITYMTRALELLDVATITSEDVAQSLIITINLIHKDLYNESLRLFLEYLASYQGIDLYTLLRSHIITVLVNLILRRKFSDFDLSSCLDKLVSFCEKKTTDDLLSNKLSFIKGRLLLHYSSSSKEDSVLDGIYFLSKYDRLPVEDHLFEGTLGDKQIFIDYLKPSMIGILLGMDYHFNSSRKEFGSEESIEQVKSLDKLVGFLEDKAVQVIHVKLLSTLSLLIRLRQDLINKELNAVILDLWSKFTSKLTPELKSELLINICVTLHDMVFDEPDKVAAIYKDLITNNINIDQGSKLKFLFFIPYIEESSAMKTLYDLLSKRYIKRDISISSLGELQDALDSVMPLLKFENHKCQIIAITKIRDLLRFNQKMLINNMLSNTEEPLDKVISSTIESLLVLSSMRDQEGSSMVAECLGIIGALNPTRLENLIYGDMSLPDSSDKGPSVTNPPFIIELIEKLTNSLFSDQMTESEAANYALQVVIKNYLKPLDKSIRDKLSPSALKACQICQNTSYSGLKKAQPDLTRSVFEKFKFEGRYSYRDWLDRFSLNLTSIIGYESIRDVFLACSYVFKYNVKLAEYLIPHIMVHIIAHEKHEDIYVLNNEIMAILNEDIGVSSQDLDIVNKDDSRGSIQTLHFQCSNMVFCAFDEINRAEGIVRNLKDNREIRDQQNFKVMYQKLNQFLESIPKDRLAIIATKCRSHARALCYLDQYLFKRKNQFDMYATVLQKIFFALDDTYEAAGVQMVRTTPTSIGDDIANYESSGRFDKALTCCLTAIESTQTDPDRGLLVEDALRCLSHQGDYMRLYEKSYQLTTEYSQYKRTTLPYAIEATWKLGRWENLYTIFANENTENLLEIAPVSQGYILKSALEDGREIPQKLKLVRHRLMKPLSIAMMDRSGYFRGYQNLLNLHSIEDFNQMLELLNENQPYNLNGDENAIDKFLVSFNANFNKLLELWDKRNKLVQPSSRNLDLLQTWQRAIIQIVGKRCPKLENRINIDVGRSWLLSGDSAREGKYFDRSFFCLTQARRWFGSEFERLDLKTRAKYHISKAKLDWDQGEQTKAIRGLKLTYERLKTHPLYRHLEARMKQTFNQSCDPFPQLNNMKPCIECKSFDQLERESFAEIKMLLTQYSEAAAAGIPATLFFMYEECVHLGVFQEDTYFRLARYYDKLLTYYVDNPNLCGDQPVDEKGSVDSTQKHSQSFVFGDKDEVYTKLMEHSIVAFGNSLKYGVKHIRESMPRMLNIWYDLGTKLIKQGQGPSRRGMSSRVEVTVRFIDELKKTLPSYYFLIASSILLSRVCHPHSGVSKKTCEILEVLLTKYPLQVTWLMLALINDSKGDNDDRKKAAKSIVQTCRRKETKVKDAISSTIEFSNEIMAIAKNNRDREGKNIKRFGAKVPLSAISKTAATFNFAKHRVIAPVQSTIRAIVPTAISKQDPDKYLTYPAQDLLFVESFEPDVRNFNSLQQPRAITLKCSDGKSVSLLCKVGDDLRKDSRCIEFLNLLNSILRRDSQSNARFMEIQTFLVLPLDSCVGIIEMVPDLETLRNLIDPLYKERRPAFSMHDQLPKNIKREYPEEVKKLFVKLVLPKVTPPVLPTWFLRQFPEPTSWYMARLAFTRSSAVVSMGGYIIGLGDRHLDNILVNKRDGRVVHVDFNLLFHQGETLTIPELVPFRLTQNFVAAFGPLGTEGNFRKVCEITMRVMRKEKDALLTTLKPFMHDPCSEWIKVREKSANKPDQEDKHAENRSAKFRIEVTEKKLKGYPRSKSFKPLTLLDSYSVEAQVDNLIDEATDLGNLAMMYFGWCPHI